MTYKSREDIELDIAHFNNQIRDTEEKLETLLIQKSLIENAYEPVLSD